MKTTSKERCSRESAITGCYGVTIRKKTVTIHNTDAPHRKVDFSRKEWADFIADAKKGLFDR